MLKFSKILSKNSGFWDILEECIYVKICISGYVIFESGL
jgi:hypothetical protein